MPIRRQATGFFARTLAVAAGLVLAASGLLAGTGGAQTIARCVIRPHTVCAHRNLRAAHLTNAHLSYANLAGANLTGANLRGADLRFANL